MDYNEAHARALHHAELDNIPEALDIKDFAHTIGSQGILEHSRYGNVCRVRLSDVFATTRPGSDRNGTECGREVEGLGKDFVSACRDLLLNLHNPVNVVGPKIAQSRTVGLAVGPTLSTSQPV